MKTIVENIKKELKDLGNSKKAELFPSFFKAGKGQYAEGDVFLGISVPNQRKIAKQHYKEASQKDISMLLASEVHEHRFTATELLQFKYQKAKTEDEKEEYISFYLDHLSAINNRDLVDNTAYSLLGDWLKDKEDRSILYDFARSKHIRKMRIAIVATMAFLRQGQTKDTMAIAQIILKHQINKDPKTEKGGREGRELGNKAVGRLLREASKVDRAVLLKFLDQHTTTMPRTMLRYSIERLPEEQRLFYLKLK